MFDRQGSRKYLNDAERCAFLREARNEFDIARRAFCLTLFYTGCRISEALNLTAKSFDLTSKAIVLKTLKRRKDDCFRLVPVPDTLVNLLHDLVMGKDADAKIWDFSRATGYRLIKRYMRQAGIVGGMAMPKGLRHGVAVACLTQKIPLSTVKKWLGHARLETTAIYLDVSGAEERNLAERIWDEK